MSEHQRASRRHAAPRVELEPEIDKVLACIGFLIQESERRSLVPTQYDIVKALFFADKSHLNTYGRPITFDNYVAMRHGPVPSLGYDLLKLNRDSMDRHHLTGVPWQRQPAEYKGKGCFRFFASRLNGEDILAESEIEALDSALSVVSSLTFWQIRELTHNDPAYKEAWAVVESDNGSNPMSLGMLFDAPDYASAEHIAFLSKQIASNKSDKDEYGSAIISTWKT